MATPPDSYGSGSMEESKSAQFCIGFDLNDLKSEVEQPLVVNIKIIK